MAGGETLMSDAAETLLSGYDPQVREAGYRLRALIRQLVPDAEERVYEGWQVIGYSLGQGMQSQFCAISPQKARINLQFARGTDLPDPCHMLEGSGKKMRHVRVTTPQDVEREGLPDVITAAAALVRSGG